MSSPIPPPGRRPVVCLEALTKLLDEADSGADGFLISLVMLATVVQVAFKSRVAQQARNILAWREKS